MKIERQSPPGNQANLLASPQVPVFIDGDFSITEEFNAFDALRMPLATQQLAPVVFRPNPSYERYLRMHKVFVGASGAQELVEVYERLRDEPIPRYLAAAASAATEAALVDSSKSRAERLSLIGGAALCWLQALQTQRLWNQVGPQHMIEHEFPYRIALDLAVMPVLADMVRGDVRAETTERVFKDCLNIAQANAIQAELSKQAGDVQALGEHTGLGYECNALLAFNRRKSQTWFVIPSTVRSDSGYHHRRQTHDLLVVHQRWGELQSMTPVEIKSVTGRKDLERYHALLVRGKLHLSVMGRHRPDEMLEAITASAEGVARPAERARADIMSERFMSMVRDYNAGHRLGQVATLRSVTEFRDNSVVVAKHPGLKVA